MNKSTWNILYLFIVFFCVQYDLSSQNVIIETDQDIRKISVNDDGRLYVIVKGKVCFYEGNSKVDNCIDMDHGITDVIIVRDNFFYVYYDNVLVTYKENEVHRRDTFPDLILCGIADNGTTYIGAADGLYMISDHNDGIVSVAFKGEFINDISLGKDSEIVVALDGGAATINDENQVLNKVESETIFKLVEYNQNGTYVALNSDNEIVFLDFEFSESFNYEFGKIKDISYENGKLYLLSSQGVYAIDNRNQIINITNGNYSEMCLLSNSLLLVKENKVLAFDLICDQISSTSKNYSIYSEDDNNYWVGRNKKINQYFDDQLYRTIDIPTNKNELFISTIAVSKDYIFAGTMGEGLFVFDTEGKLVQHHLQQNLNNRNNIIQLKISDNKLWIVFLNGVAAIDIRKLSEISDLDDIDNNSYLYCIEPISDTEFYLGTSNRGVMHVNNGYVTRYLEGITVLSLTRVGGVIYIGTEKNGIYKIENNEVELVYQSINPIYSIHAIDSLLVVSESSKSFAYDCQSYREFPLHIGTLDNSQLNGVAADNYFLYVAYSNGILKVDKANALQLNSIDLHLNRPIQFNKLVPVDKTKFKYDENSITFTFHPNSYYFNQNVTYKYRLIGQDSSWNLIQGNRVDYFNLRSGAYTFEVAQGYSSDFTPQKLSRFDFVIGKPFWKTLWFGLLLLLTTLVVLYYIIKRREAIILKKKDRDKERLKFELDQLKNQIDPHFLFNSFNSLIGLIEEDSDKAVVATEQLSQLYRNILSHQGRDIIPIREEINIARDYFAIHKIRFENNIELLINMDKEATGQIISLSTQFLIENAIKHNIINKNNKLIIIIDVSNQYLIVSNNLNNKKIKESKSGYGLNNLKKRYELFSKKEIVIENNGSSFTVKLPIIYD